MDSQRSPCLSLMKEIKLIYDNTGAQMLESKWKRFFKYLHVLFEQAEALALF